ncbi:11457_t:CDS:2, partial [Scutellospora calospora]
SRARPELNGPRGLPIIGNFILLLRSKGFFYYCLDLIDKYGPIFTFTLPKKGRFIMINDPKLIEHMLKTNFEYFEKGDILHELMYDIFGDGIFAVDGYKWKFQRRIISYLFQGKNFKDLICVSMAEKSKIVLNILRNCADNGKPIDLQDLFYRFTLDTLGDIDFGCLSNPEKPVQFAVDFDYAQRNIDWRWQQPLWKYIELYSERGRQMRKVCKKIDNYIYNIINNRKSETGENTNDILTLFINAVDKDGTKLNDRELRDAILNLIIAGRDTTAQALSWMMYSIMANPFVEDSLLKEINSILSPTTPIPSYDDIKAFKYANATFYETLRLYPSVPKNGKVCVKDHILPNGIPVYADEFVIYNPWAMGRDKKLWGENAEIFNPERFLNSEDMSKPNQFKFIAFHAGPRNCLGQQFATVEAIMLVTTILREFKFELVPGQKSPPALLQSITLPMKEPLMAKVSRRL